MARAAGGGPVGGCPGRRPTSRRPWYRGQGAPAPGCAGLHDRTSLLGWSGGPPSPRRGAPGRAVPSDRHSTDVTASPVPAAGASSRTYEVRTYGCQMNVHDSERLAGLLEDAGYVAGRRRRRRRRRRVQHLRGAGERRQPALRQPRPPARRSRRRTPGMQIAVGGCLAQKDRGDDRPARRRGSTSSSAPTTSARCRCCSSGPGTTTRRRSRSSSRSRSSRRRCRPGASRRTPPGCRSRSAATTPARSASCRRCAARRRTAGPATSSPRSRRWSPRASSRSPCSGRTSTPTASSSATGRRSASCCAPAATIDGPGAGALHQPAPARTSPTT